MKKLNIFKVKIKDKNQHGVNAISLVSSPAINIDFITLAKQKGQKVMALSSDKDKKLIVGAVLVPNRLIYRRLNGEEFYITFDKQTIRQSAELFLKKNKQKNITLEHDGKVGGVTVVESWIVENSKTDKSALYNLSLPAGSWCVVMKVDNDELWKALKNDKKFKGFSIEGHFMPELKKIKPGKEKKNKKIKIEKRKVSLIKALLELVK